MSLHDHQAPVLSIRTLLSSTPPATLCCVRGWIRTMRDQKAFTFLELVDGGPRHLQVILDASLPHYAEIVEQLSTGAAVAVVGELVKSPGQKQSVELRATQVEVVGTCPANTYPLQKKRHSFEFLRSIAHLRPRTNTLGAVARVRSALAFAIHEFFQKRDFLYVQTPIITTSDCEGAGELFRVTTLPVDGARPGPEEADFFGRPAFLTVSGQLGGECFAQACGKVYTFGPTFRAENSHTSRHLAEFWMVEPEVAFANLQDNIELATAFTKEVIQAVLTRCPEDMEFFDRWISPGKRGQLEQVIAQEWQQITYTEAIALLQRSGRSFAYPCTWGANLQSEHERYLCEELMQAPVIVTDYPAEVKAFYMRMNEDGKTVAAMDLLCPQIGEIIGGSQREERLDVLVDRMRAVGIDPTHLDWYLDLRRFGSTPHAGFGLGFERLLQYVTGMENIRDCIAFPRVPGHADY